MSTRCIAAAGKLCSSLLHNCRCSLSSGLAHYYCAKGPFQFYSKNKFDLLRKDVSIGDLIFTSQGYLDLLSLLKSRIRTAQVRAATAVNQELVLLYWTIGKEILLRQKQDGWGAGVIERLSKDLRSEFPDMQGLSPRNLGYMKAFAEAWPDQAILQQAVAKLPWGHNVQLLDYVKSSEERLWYVRKAIEHGWSRNILVMQIESGLYRRQGKATTNFQATLPPLDSDLAQELLKDPYNFDFLTLAQNAHERDLERGLLVHLRQFLIELGAGFAFVGSQVPLEVGVRTSRSTCSSIT